MGVAPRWFVNDARLHKWSGHVKLGTRCNGHEGRLDPHMCMAWHERRRTVSESNAAS